MAETLYFYDLETTGVNPRKDRIMQFAGQRTDLDLNPLGDPDNYLIKMSNDVLPNPDAILVTRITPQRTIEEGISEAEFGQEFSKNIMAPNTTYLGFNSVRFDDEFMRFFLYRNFYDPYQWQYLDESSRWDLLDTSRMARALRPEGINWPTDSKGNPTNRLELLAKENNLLHESAHDALSDVNATIALAKLLKQKQNRLYDYLFQIRKKSEIERFLRKEELFVYSSGKYDSQNQKTSVVYNLGKHPDEQSVLVYDLRYNPKEFLDLTPKELADRWRYDKDSPQSRLPVKSLKFNRCPAVAPISVLDRNAQQRINVDLKQINSNYMMIQKNNGFLAKLTEALAILNDQRSTQGSIDAEQALYQNFIPNKDRYLSEKVHLAKPEVLGALAVKFNDERLRQILPHYKARNYPDSLSAKERTDWNSYRRKILMEGNDNSIASRFGKRLIELQNQPNITPEDKYLLTEIQLYAEDLMSNLQS